MEAIIFLQGADLDWELTRRDLSNLSTAQPCRLSGRVVAGGGSIEVISHYSLGAKASSGFSFSLRGTKSTRPKLRALVSLNIALKVLANFLASRLFTC